MLLPMFFAVPVADPVPDLERGMSSRHHGSHCPDSVKLEFNISPFIPAATSSPVARLLGAVELRPLGETSSTAKMPAGQATMQVS